jgi:hypothetical protein
MKKYGIEEFMTDVEAFLKQKLNTKITEINTEKGDFALDLISDDAYLLQTWNDRLANFNPILFYRVANVNSDGNGPALRKAYSVDVVVILEDVGQDDNIAKRLFRYSRALEEIFITDWATMKNSVKLKVDSLVPVSFKLVNSSEDYRAIGVTLDFTIA